MIVGETLVPENQKLNEQATFILANSSVLITPVAFIDINTPYLSRNIPALCMENPSYDLIIGNVNGARDSNDQNQNWKTTFVQLF